MARQQSTGTNLLMRRYIGPSLGAASLAALLLCPPAAAEPGARGDDGVQIAQARAPQQPGQAPATGAAAAAAPAGGDSALKQRVEQLEEQLVDMQVVVGTLELLARGGAPAAPAPRGNDAAGGYSGSADDLRIDGLETQVRALAAQLEQLTAQVHALASEPRHADAGAAPSPPASAAAEPSDAPPADRFGSTTVTAGTNDAIGGLIESEPGTKPPPASAEPPPAGGCRHAAGLHAPSVGAGRCRKSQATL